MKKKTSKKKTSRKKSEEAQGLVFRVKKLHDIQVHSLDHPLPLPGYKSTLPGAPGWWAKESPGV